MSKIQKVIEKRWPTSAGLEPNLTLVAPRREVRHSLQRTYGLVSCPSYMASFLFSTVAYILMIPRYELLQDPRQYAPSIESIATASTSYMDKRYEYLRGSKVSDQPCHQ